MNKYNDPIYDTREIKKNAVWRIAFILSEIHNDDAPIGWSRYIYDAEQLMKEFNITFKEVIK